MGERRPLVSVGLPVYNAAPYLEHGIASIREQDFQDWELFISDNGSTDGTWEVICEHMKADSRIRAERSEVNHGQRWNLNRVFDAARGQYFMWQADHDLRQRTYLSRATAILDSDPECVLVFCGAVQLDANGNIDCGIPERMETRGMKAVDRYIFVMQQVHSCFQIYGLIRRETLAKTGLFGRSWGTDALLLADLALHGSFAHIDENLFFPCRNRPFETRSEKKARVCKTLDPVEGERIIRQGWQSLFRTMRDQHLELLRNSALSRSDRWHAMLATIDSYQENFGV